MDITIRKNVHCIIGLPRCDFVFSSTRACFVAYGFKTSPLEMSIINGLLKNKGIQCEEAGGQLAPGQSAFCQKICSKIITSQFCIVLLNEDDKNGQLIPNANVNMEYGLMLGFNKFLIPFQRESHSLPFNVAGLDTVKYNNNDFAVKATNAIDIAIYKTRQDHASSTTPNQLIELFLLSKKAIFPPIEDIAEKNIFRMGSPFGFSLLNDFSGMSYIYFGNFTAFRPEIIIWRLNMLNDLLSQRRASSQNRIEMKLATKEQTAVAESVFKKLKIWILVTRDDDKEIISSAIKPFQYSLDFFSIADIKKELDMISSGTS
ncbi:MAG: TIR domain-containing protein [Planctomycetota bacterium]